MRWLLAIWLLLLTTTGIAGEYAAQVSNVQITLQKPFYLLSADIAYQLSDEATKALQNGVALYWIVHLKVLQHRDFLWDYTLVDREIRYRLQYHALLKMYRVKNEGSGEILNFSTLAAALNVMATLRDWQLVEQNQLNTDQTYQVAIKVSFDRDALPLPLRPIAYTYPQWYLSSAWTLWPFQK